MQYIFGCKMYMNRSQVEQAQIRASLSSPINVELVKQLAEYLDDEYLEELIHQSEAKKAAEAREDESEIAKDTSEDTEELDESSKDFVSVPHAATSDRDHKISDLLKDEDSETPVPAAPEPPVDSESVDSEGSESVGQSTALHGSVVTCADVKTLLEDIADTQGVVRVQIRGSETWIHYSDITNLNTVMEPVIACMNEKYPSLHFSRLARTENAVVFSS